MPTYQATQNEFIAVRDTFTQPKFKGLARALINPINAFDNFSGSNHTRTTHAELGISLTDLSTVRLRKVVTVNEVATITDFNGGGKNFAIYQQEFVTPTDSYSVIAKYQVYNDGEQYLRDVCLVTDEILTRLITWDEFHGVYIPSDSTTAWFMDWVNPDFVGGNP